MRHIIGATACNGADHEDDPRGYENIAPAINVAELGKENREACEYVNKKRKRKKKSSVHCAIYIERSGGHPPMYVNKYPITTHDESRKSFKSSDVAKRDVEMMVVSSKEKKKPSSILNIGR